MYDLYAAGFIASVACIVLWRFTAAFRTRENRLPEVNTGGAAFLPPSDALPDAPVDRWNSEKSVHAPSAPTRRPKKQSRPEEPAQVTEAARPKRARLDSGLRYPLEIQYRSEDGAVTTRAITVRGVTGLNYGPGMLAAFCHKRNAERTFAVDRIIEAIDGETGEVLTDVVGRLRAVAEERATQRAPKPRKRG